MLTLEGETNSRLIGIPFYASDDENDFRDALNTTLSAEGSVYH